MKHIMNSNITKYRTHLRLLSKTSKDRANLKGIINKTTVKCYSLTS